MRARRARIALGGAVVALAACTPIKSPDDRPDVRASDAAADVAPDDGACTPDAAGVACGPSFTTPAPLLELVPTATVRETLARPQPFALFSPWISPDALRLYYVLTRPTGSATTAAGVYRASRGDPTGRFTQLDPVPLRLSDGGAGVPFANPVSVALSNNELEIFVYGTPSVPVTAGQVGVYTATRATPDAPFDPLVPLLGFGLPLAGGREFGYPSLRADDRELLVVASPGVGARLHRLVRDGPGAPFAAPEPLTLPGADDALGDSTPSLSRDGLTLYFARRPGPDGASGWRIYTARRASPDATTFGAPAEIAALAAPALDPPAPFDLLSPVVSETTRELFVTSNRPWSPGAPAIWRARACAGAACVPPAVECLASGARSPDGRHCYVFLGNGIAHDAAADQCAAREPAMHLVTLESAEEASFVVAYAVAASPTLRTAPGAGIWTDLIDDSAGGCTLAMPDCAFHTQSGAPVVYARWANGEPSEGERCVTMYSGGALVGRYNNITCDYLFAAVCERELDEP